MYVSEYVPYHWIIEIVSLFDPFALPEYWHVVCVSPASTGNWTSSEMVS